MRYGFWSLKFDGLVESVLVVVIVLGGLFLEYVLSVLFSHGLFGWLSLGLSFLFVAIGRFCVLSSLAVLKSICWYLQFECCHFEFFGLGFPICLLPLSKSRKRLRRCERE